MITPHLRHPRDRRQAVCGIPADQVRRWDSEDPCRGHTREDRLSSYEEAARPDDANHPVGDATLLDTLRRVVADRQIAKIDGVLIDVWLASVTVLIWDHLRDDKRRCLLTLPAHELILRCIRIYSGLTTRRGDR